MSKNYRRKTLFYTVVLIIPTVLMAFLSMAVFFLPADSGTYIHFLAVLDRVEQFYINVTLYDDDVTFKY